MLRASMRISHFPILHIRSVAISMICNFPTFNLQKSITYVAAICKSDLIKFVCCHVLQIRIFATLHFFAEG